MISREGEERNRGEERSGGGKERWRDGVVNRGREGEEKRSRGNEVVEKRSRSETKEILQKS